ncbi:His Kinase A (phospho-acceptor) domain-containing protein [Mucilaginibacter pineti]|uniref:histidine kinase n=1 Tax=Mucilaginibacter pineti TaxID=1391627 RepID=A0A1G7AUM3_9SPHI|nr:ATP-binding protein [Mucilaginibacter pineti]SDE18539.1 His Kinase A (phospho-acceptor) domain-containing protein [Mucilaginibacter pineti]
MIKGVNKIPIKRYGLIVALLVVLFSGVFYLYLHYHRAQNLKNSIGKLISARENSSLIDSCLLILYSADNNIHLYALTGDKEYKRKFAIQIKEVSATVKKVKSDQQYSTNLTPATLGKLISEKAAKTDNYLKLQQLTDSLIKLSIKAEKMQSVKKTTVAMPVVKITSSTIHIDTIKLPAKAPERKKFFGRIVAAFSGKQKDQKPADAMIIKRDTQIKTVEQVRTEYIHLRPKPTEDHIRLFNANANLKNSEREILRINNNLISEIIKSLKQYKIAEQNYARESKVELADQVSDVFNEYGYLSKLTIAALFILMVVVLYNIWKLYHNGRYLVYHSEKAEEYAVAKSSFMASMSHEIRTPLNSVLGFSEQLSMTRLDDEQTEQINAIRSSSQMLLEVVNEILDFSKYETGKINFESQPFMPYQALEDVLNTVSIQAAKKGIKLKMNLQFDKNTCFTGDVLRLKQVVMNLLVNAIKFSTNGTVLLHARLMTQTDGQAALKVRVKDNGIGIKKQDLPAIFDEFVQVSDAQKVTHRKGTGLGLAICKKIIELQGGSIRVISELGKGSVFSFELPFLPANKNDIVVETPVSKEDLARAVKNKHVLLADDNQLNVLLASTILKKWSITCHKAYNGQEALALFNANNYDLVLTDILMPVMGGLELTANIRKNKNMLRAETPIIALTANVLKEDRDNYMRSGVNDIVLKPFAELNLIEKIAGVLKTKEVPFINFLITESDLMV